MIKYKYMSIQLVPNKPDAEVAEELKQEIIKAYEPVLLALEKAVRAGFQVQVNVGIGPLGKMQIAQLIIAKHF